jgi:uncharacterized protein YdhG (YjbR/CyaY superfamily)
MASTSSAKKNANQVAVQRRAYFASRPPAARKVLNTIRDAVRSIAPSAVEHFSYGIPGFRLDGEPLVWYAAFKEHYSMYPMGTAFLGAHASELKGYKTSKGTVRFPVTKPPSSALVKRLVRARITQIRKNK